MVGSIRHGPWVTTSLIWIIKRILISHFNVTTEILRYTWWWKWVVYWCTNLVGFLQNSAVCRTRGTSYRFDDHTHQTRRNVNGTTREQTPFLCTPNANVIWLYECGLDESHTWWAENSRVRICKSAEIVGSEMDVLSWLATSARLDSVGLIAMSWCRWCHSHISLL